MSWVMKVVTLGALILVLSAGTALAATLAGTAGNDNMSGSGVADQIFALEGDDTVDGFGGNDEVYGNENSDNLIGAEGSDKIYGNTGNDRRLGARRLPAHRQQGGTVGVHHKEASSQAGVLPKERSLGASERDEFLRDAPGGRRSRESSGLPLRVRRRDGH